MTDANMLSTYVRFHHGKHKILAMVPIPQLLRSQEYMSTICHEREKNKPVDLHMASILAEISFACLDDTPESMQNVFVW